MTNYYHYTIEHKAREILDSGYLKPTGTPATPREKPVLWFSTNTLYEVTAIKPLMIGGQIQYPTWEEYRSMFKLYRFGLMQDAIYLAPWRTICKNAKTPSKLRKSMERVGQAQGGRTSQWFGTLDRVNTLETVMEVMDADGIWRWARDGDAPQPLPDNMVSGNFDEIRRGLSDE
jgi:hypothetical protein